jgi:hypothetical protein
MTQKCAQVGPRGGRCRRNTQVIMGWPLDFCSGHNQMVRDGIQLYCSRCGDTTAGPKD